MKITSSESKDNLGISGKGLITYLILKAKVIPKKYKKERYAIVNVSKKELSKIIRDFEKLPYESYERKSSNHKPTERYFYLSRQLGKCMMRTDALNLENYPVRMEMTSTKQIPTSHIFSTNESELKEFLVDKNLSQICSMDKDESRGIIVNECYTKEEETEFIHNNINKQKYAKNEAEYEESSVTNEVPRYFNIFECGRNILNRLDVTYEQACMATTKEKFYTKMLETLVDYNDHNNAPFSNDNLRQAVSKVMVETE